MYGLRAALDDFVFMEDMMSCISRFESYYTW